MTARRAASAGGSLAALCVTASGLACEAPAARILPTALAAALAGAVLGGLAGPRLLGEDMPDAVPPPGPSGKGD